MVKFLKITAVILAGFAVFAGALTLTFFVLTKDARLDESKLLSVDTGITVFDSDGEEIANASATGKRKTVPIENLRQHTVQAFIASEDRTFYSHKGLNGKRMLKALYKNIVSRSFKEGASTISQQLVKNTHLSGNKTIKRKLNEIRLTKALEKRYSKDEILEMYLNTIYFGHNCFGLESASEFYFDKSAENLTLEESAALVGLLTSPNNYSPFKNPDKCLKRRNLVLKAMAECGYITENQYEQSIKKPLNAVKKAENNRNSDYLNAVFDELEDIDLNFYKLTEGCKIYTYLDGDLQDFIENIKYPCDNSVIITTNTGTVSAYKSTIGNVKRQPASTIKPFAVYAPAIEEKLVSPYTRILDEKIDFDGYSPENHDKKYHGYVTVSDSVAMSYNVPAVKTLNTLTLERAEKYLNKMDIRLGEGEKNLALALGGMEHGLTLKQIADCTSTFANSGIYKPSRFINKIISSDGTTLYEAQTSPVRVFSEGTSSLMNDVLIQTSKTGTAKKLKNFNFDIASKTGTCGTESGNTDAYSINCTSENCIGVWLGDKENNRLKVTGGKDCCEISKQIIEKLYKNHTPQNLETDKGTEKIDIDAEEYYESNKTVIADKISPKLNIITVKTLMGNAPKETSTRFSEPVILPPEISIKNNVVNIDLRHAKYYSYLIKRNKNGIKTVIFDGKWMKTVTDVPENGVYEYTVTPYYFDGKIKHFGKEIYLPSVKIGESSKTPQIKVPDIANDEWYNM